MSAIGLKPNKGEQVALLPESSNSWRSCTKTKKKIYNSSSCCCFFVGCCGGYYLVYSFKRIGSLLTRLSECSSWVWIFRGIFRMEAGGY